MNSGISAERFEILQKIDDMLTLKEVRGDPTFVSPLEVEQAFCGEKTYGQVKVMMYRLYKEGWLVRPQSLRGYYALTQKSLYMLRPTDND